jgi:hypothetical protein
VWITTVVLFSLKKQAHSHNFDFSFFSKQKKENQFHSKHHNSK